MGVKKTTQYSVAVQASSLWSSRMGHAPFSSLLTPVPRVPIRELAHRLATHLVTVPERMKYILLEYLTLGSAGVSHNTNVDITSKVCFLCCHLRHSTKQHEKNTTFNLVISCQEKKLFKSYDLQAED